MTPLVRVNDKERLWAWIMEKKHFTEAEAKKMIGIKVRTLWEFSGVPAGTTGTVKGYYGYPNRSCLDISWDLPGRSRPFVDGFSKEEYYQFLEQIG